jgi:Tfp pilus assembly protein PilO
MKKEMLETIGNFFLLIGILVVIFIVGLAYAEEKPSAAVELQVLSQRLETVKVAFERNVLKLRLMEREKADLEKMQEDLQVAADALAKRIAELQTEMQKDIPVAGEQPAPKMDYLEDAE